MTRIDLKKWIWGCTFFFFFNASLIAAAEEKGNAPYKTVNINTVTAEELAKSVPLISLDLAKRVVEYRKKNGEFQVLQELLQIDGFTQTLLRKVKPFLFIEDLGDSDDCTC
jgi:competence ComEA-like helix-hairpin-helix protein